MTEEQVYAEFEDFDFDNNQRFQNGWSAIANVVEPTKIGVEHLKAKAYFFSLYHKPVNLEKYLSWKHAKLNKSDGTKQSGGAEKATDEKCHQPIPENHSENNPNIDNTALNSRLQNNLLVDNENDKETNFANIDSNGACSTKPNDCVDIATLLHSMRLKEYFSGSNSEHDINGVIKTEKESEFSDKAEVENSKSSIPSSADADKEDVESSLSLLEVAAHIQNGIPIPGLISIEINPTNLDPTPSTQERKLKPWEVCATEKVDS